jgi:hypothetical protein
MSVTHKGAGATVGMVGGAWAGEGEKWWQWARNRKAMTT